MPIVSMNDLLKGQRQYAGRTLGYDVRFRIETNEVKEKTLRQYMTFSIKSASAEEAGWKLGDNLNFVWDSSKKKGLLESATQSTGRPLHKYSPKVMQVRFPYLEGYELPFSEEGIIATGVKVKKGSITFILE